jgi:acyl-CoA synthetase (AMP-forming)/AMP-acid ligase II
MIFNEFKKVAEKYSNRLALNHWTYKDLLRMILEKKYQKISSSENELILVDILRAASLDKPLVIPPKFQSNLIELPETDKGFSLYLYSSGSTGNRKSIKLDEKLLFANFKNAQDCQNLTNLDKILTICSLNHTGGINAQSLPGLLSGSHVIVEKFNPYSLSGLLKKHEITVTHLIPVMIDTLLKIKKFNVPPGLKLVVAGSDCVKKEHVEFFLDRQTPFMINYGLTEAGPIIINHKFTDKKELSIFEHGVPLGKIVWCNYSINEKELYLKGDCVATDDWLLTGDCVYKKEDWFMYQGRISAGCKIVPKSY